MADARHEAGRERNLTAQALVEEAEPERPGDVLGEDAAEGTTGRIDAASELAFLKAQADRVIGLPLAGAAMPGAGGP